MTRSPSLLGLTALLAACSAELPTLTVTPEAPNTTDAIALQVDGVSEVSVSWFKDGDEVGTLRDQLSVHPSHTARGESWEVRAWPGADANRERDHASVTFTIGNAPPSVDRVVFDEDAPTSEEDLTVQVRGSDPDGDVLTWRYAWARDGETVEGEVGATLPAGLTARGETWTVSVWASDGELESEVATADVRVGNLPPVSVGVTLGPVPATERTELVATGEAIDDDGDAIRWTYVWTVDGVVVDVDASTDRLDGGSFDRGQQVQVVATPSDGTLSGEPVTSDIVTIVNAAPAAGAVAISPSEPREADTLTCTPSGFEDPDGDPEAWTYVWSIDGTVVSTEATVTGAVFDRDDVVTCAATPFDGQESGEPVVASVTVLNTAPVLGSVSLPGSAHEGDTLAVALDGAIDADGDAIAYTYAWTVDGVSAGSEPTLDSTAFDRDQDVVVTVTPEDGTDVGVAVTSSVLTISNSRPEVTSVTLAPSAPATDEDVTVTITGTDADGDPIDYTTTWSVDGTVVSSGSDTTLLSSAFSKGEEVEVSVVPDDGTDSGDAVTASVIVQNTPPSLASVAIEPSTLAEGDTATCVPSGFVDVDGDAPVYVYAWTVNGSDAGSGSTLDGSVFSRGDAVLCVVTPSDGEDDGTAVASASVSIANTAPEVTSISLSPSAPATDEDVVATVVASDADGDTVSTTFTWTVDGSVVTGETGDTLPASAFVKGQEIVATVVPDDGVDSGDPVRSDPVTAVNSAPTLASASISPSTLAEGDTATCEPAGYDDPDGDTAVYTYAWTVDGVGAGTAATLDSSAFDRDQVIVCTVTPGDGTDVGAAVASSAVTVSNSAPVVAAVGLSSTTPSTDDALTATATGVSDADGDAVDLAWAWSVNGTTVREVSGSASSDTLPSSSFAKGDTVVVTVTPTDGTDAGTAVLSATATVQNSVPTVDGVSFTPTSPTTSTDLTATPSGTDPDGDTLTWTTTWYLDDEGAGTFTALAATGATLSASEFDKDDQLYVEVVAHDGDADSATFTSAVVTVGNTAPDAPSGLTLTPTADPDGTLTCTASGASDPDGDTVTWRYRWYNGSTLHRTDDESGAATLTLSSSITATGDVWTCEATAYDGTDESATVSATAAVNLGEDCDQLYGWGYTTSGDYDLDTPTGGEQTLYCEMRADGGWTELVDADYTVDACSGGWVSSSQYGGSCIINGPARREATFDNHGITWDAVRIDIGISQFASMDGFRTGSSPSDAYVDGAALLYDDGGLDDIHTWSLIVDLVDCGSQTPPFTLSGSFSCSSSFNGVAWSTVWSSGYEFDGFNQYSLAAATTSPPEVHLMADQATGDEDLAVRHLTILVK